MTPFLRRSMLCFIAAMLGSAAGPAFGHAEAVAVSLSAQRVTYHSAQPDNLAQARIWVSASGFREQPEIVPAGSGPELVFVANFDRQEQWLLSPSAHKAARLPVDKGESMAEAERPGGILTRRPCQGFTHASQLAVESYEGLQVERWSCHTADQSTATIQRFAPDPGLVVWEQEPEGFVTALRDMHFGPQAGELFLPSQDLRVLSLDEFYTGRRSLPRYAMPAADEVVSE